MKRSFFIVLTSTACVVGVIQLGVGVADAAPLPSITSLTYTFSTVQSAGGPVTLSAHVAHSAHCTWSVAPAIAPLPKTVNCTTGTYSQTINMPVNSGVARSFTFKLKAVKGAHSASKTLVVHQDASVADSLSWTSPEQVDPSIGTDPDDFDSFLADISCPTTTFCMADDGYGNVIEFDGSWQQPELVVPSCANDTGCVRLGLISCASASLCMAIGPNPALFSSGDMYEYDGVTWTAVPVLGPGDSFLSVSCPTTSFCAATGEPGVVLTYTPGTGWSTPKQIDSQQQAGLVVSCTSSTFCMAFDAHNGTAYKFNGIQWSGPTSMDPHTGTWEDTDSISCYSSAFCVAIDGNGNSMTYNGSTWSHPSFFWPLKLAETISCPSYGFCEATTTQDVSSSEPSLYVLSFKMGIWSTGKSIDPSDTSNIGGSVSCVRNQIYCVVGDAAGNVMVGT